MMNRLLLMSLVIFLSACNTAVVPTHMRPSPDDLNFDPNHLGLLSEYQIGVGDGLQISVWRNPELSSPAIVLPDGNISVPLVGNVAAAGETTESLAVTISEALGRFIREPQVTVTVTNTASSEFLQRIRITGAVGQPQSVPYRRGITVLDLVLSAGGTTPFALANDTLLYRNTEKGLRIYPIRLQDIMEKGRLGTNYLLLPADIVTIPEKAF